MATCVLCSPNRLVSSAATCPASTSSPCFSPSIFCSSKRKKKASSNSQNAKPIRQNPPQNGDFFLGVDGGASTFTALQPLLDEEDTLSEQKQMLELKFSHIQKLSLNAASRENEDPLLRFTLAAHKPFNAGSASQVLDGQDEQDEVGNDDDEDASTYDSPLTLGDATKELQSHKEEEENDEADDDVDDEDDDFEWVEINGADDDDVDEERYVYWEGDLPPMTKEEEAKIVRRGKKDLARLEKAKRTSAKGLVSYGKLYGEADDEEGEDDDEEEDEEDDLEDYNSDDSETDEEAFAQFTASTRTLDATNDTSYTKTNRKLSIAHVQLENKPEDALDSVEDKTAFAAHKIKKGKAENSRKLQMHSEESERKNPKRSLPAVMRSFDKAKIFVKAGNGGNGVVAFRREKYVPFGGPSGGSGGRGGDIYVKSDPSLNSLLSFRRSVHFRAGRGSHGMGKSQDGAAGADCTINVPPGTLIREADDGFSGPGKVLIELTRPDQCELLLLGGRGGRGNAAFRTSRNKTPQLAENGEEGPEMWVELELKLVADVGIIGVPNAGKSTLLSVISAARPEIGAYPFTTLLPNLGVVPIASDSTMVVADLPGLLEGAHLGIGLGHEFLRHTERCRVLVHMVDGTSQQPEQEYEAVRLELQLFNPVLSEKPYIVAFNKMDIPEAADRWPNFQAYLQQKGIEPICMSAATKMGVTDAVNKAYTLLKSLPSSTSEIDSDKESEGADEMTVGEIIRRQRSAPIEEFEIFQDEVSKAWQVQGAGLERFVQMTNWEYFEAFKRFQHILNVSGVNKALKNRGVVEGETVIVGEVELVWNDSEDILATDWKRGFRGSRLWPH